MSKQYGRNIARLMVGSTIAQAIPVIISPILTRIYTPADLGVLGLFLALSNIFGQISNGRYELAIGLPQDDEDAIHVAAVCLLITCSLSLVLFVLVCCFDRTFAHWLGNLNIKLWLYFVPLAVLLIGVFQVLNYLSIRMSLFSSVAKANVVKSVCSAAVQVGLGLLKPGAFGLILGNLFGNAGCIASLFNKLRKETFWKSIRWRKLKDSAVRYQNFPKFMLWSVLFNTLSRNAASIFISSFYSIATLGYYALVQRIFALPVSVIATSFSQVYLNAATEERKRTGRAKHAFYYSLKKLLLFVFPISVFLFFAVEPLIVIVFGAKWAMAGEYAKILIPFFFCQFVSSALSISAAVFEKQRISFFIGLSLMVSWFIVMALCYVLRLDVYQFLILVSTVFSIQYVIFLMIYWFIVVQPFQECSNA